MADPSTAKAQADLTGDFGNLASRVMLDALLDRLDDAGIADVFQRYAEEFPGIALDELALDACRVIAAEMKCGGRWNIKEGRLVLLEA
jgi:hypothetical protein